MSDYIKIDKYISDGIYWRAKEMLQGRLSTSKYDSILFEKYGQVLMAMGDLLEAGKYLFLSGVRRNEYQEAISIYLNRYGRKNINFIFHTFPRAVQGSEFSSYPETVISELSEKGWKPNAVKDAINIRQGATETLSSKLLGMVFVVVFLLLFIGFVAQGFRGIQWLWQWMAN